jgi:PAS domain S-box-containing protein
MQISRQAEDAERGRARIESLRERLREPGEAGADEALRELSATLQALQVAEEELRQQNDTLREAQFSLERERERYRSLFNFAPDAYIVTDQHGVVLEANAASAELLGVSARSLVGKPLSVAVVMEHRKDFRGRFHQVVGGNRVTGWEFEVVTPRGPVPVEATVQPYAEPAEDQKLVLRWLLRDITERRRAQSDLRGANSGLAAANRDLESRVAERTRELKEANQALLAEAERRELLVEELRASEGRLMERTRELGRSNQDLQDFAYVASHDLREPLRGISNYATFLLEDSGPRLGEEGREKLEVITRLCRRLHDLLESLLEYSRAGRMELHPEPVEASEVALEALDSLAPWFAENGAKVEVGRLPRVKADRARLGEVVSNLMVNAVKYNTAPEKMVWLDECAGAPPGFARLCVRDNGIGIEPRHAEAVFKMFRRLHPRDRFGGGTGAGLAIVRKIIERHGGKIWVESTPGKGSTFVLELPAP